MRADKNPLLVICECAQIPRILKTCFDGALYQVQILKKYKNLNENIQLLANFKALEGGGNTTLYASTNKAKTPPLVILIIGESTQRNYLNLYGYPLPTTPKLNTLRDSQNLFVFSNVISPATHTDESLRKVLTFSNYENEQIPCISK